MTRMGYLLNRPALQMRQRAERILKPLAILPPHFGVMATLEGGGPMTQRQLGATLRIDPTTMVWLIDHLEKRGFVHRDKHPTDRRAHLVKLSAAGKSAFLQASGRLEQVEEEFLAPLTKTERDELRRLLAKLFRSVPVQSIART
jgi:DNA-binding MarR family transcriptional regulator